MWVDAVRLEVLAINQSTGGGPNVAVSVSVESWLSKVGRHCAVCQESSIEFQLLHFLSDAALFLFSKLSLLIFAIRISRAFFLTPFLRLFPRHAVGKISVLPRAALHLSFLCISSGSSCHCLASEAHLTKLILYELPLQLHRSNEGSGLTTLIYTFFNFNGCIHDFRSLAK